MTMTWHMLTAAGVFLCSDTEKAQEGWPSKRRRTTGFCSFSGTAVTRNEHLRGTQKVRVNDSQSGASHFFPPCFSAVLSAPSVPVVPPPGTRPPSAGAVLRLLFRLVFGVYIVLT